MGLSGIPGRHLALSGATTVATSSQTGNVCYVGDWLAVSVSIETQTNAASRFTFVASNQDGFQAPLATPSRLIPTQDWSILTTIMSQGVYTFDPSAGFRWLNVIQPSASSATVTFVGRT